MRTPFKVVAFGAALVAIFAGALGVGAAVGSPAPVARDHAGEQGEEHGAEPDGGDDGAAGAADLPGGLMVSDRGYTLDLEQDSLPPEAGAPLGFRILGADGEPVTRYEPSHDKDLHLIAVRRDLTGFQHVHPDLAADGTWSVPIDLSAGQWRVFADFVPAQGPAAGENMKLGADLAVAGDYQPVVLPTTTLTAQVDDYTVTLDGALVLGQESELRLSVARGGQPVTDLQPYLEAYGHLVALRDRDLAYLHVHPAGGPDDGQTTPGPGITFYATAPSNGAYRLFLDFRHNNQVRTAEFTITTDTHGKPMADKQDADGQAATPRTTEPRESTGTHDKEPGHGHGG